MYSDNNTFEDILKRMLDKVPDTLDKRQGSIIYDALAPAAAELAQCYISLDVFLDQTYLENAVGENLDNRVADYGISRTSATYSQRIGTFKDSDNNLMSINIGSRFGIPNASGGYNYTITSEIETGKYVLTCETAGTVGNEYFGELLPITSINNLGSAVLGDVYIAGEDAETDDSLRLRTINKLRETPFGGNIAEYKQYVEGLDGIGACLVIPIWNGGGTVKILPITSSFEIPTTAKINEIQTALDPTQNAGKGFGIAPIGHVVTVAAPSKLDINISATVEVDENNTLTGLKDKIEEALKNYIQEVQEDWSTNDELTLYISRMIASILMVKGVTNVENLKINNSTDNLTIKPKESPNKYPMLGEVTLSES